MSAMVRHIERQREQLREEWRSGCIVGAVTVFIVLAPVIVLLLVLANKQHC